MYLNPGSLNAAQLNLGILAHVDAGKTSLTEWLLYAAGVIGELGRVDDGNTQTDSLALERQRGITIKAAVASFVLGPVTVNLIDTPGHPDFIAEVERSLGVLDGAILVVSAVEGVQAQTRVLWRALERLKLPTLIFVNKIDRRGAQDERLLARLAERLTPNIVPLGSVADIGTREATFLPYDLEDAAFASGVLEHLAEHDEALLAAYVDSETALSASRLGQALAAQTKCALVQPVFFGSAMTGAGIDALRSGIQTLLPTAPNDPESPLSAVVFKVDRGPTGEKIAYVRMKSGTLRVRDRVALGPGREGKVTAIRVLGGGSDGQQAMVRAGQIAKLWGLREAQIGDTLGFGRASAAAHHFALPTLETVITPRHPDDRASLHAALSLLAEGDPLINLRHDEQQGELALSLYGEVQKEVIAATLQGDFGLEATFSETTPLYTERPAGCAEAVERLGETGNPFLATVGLHVAPAPVGSGVSLCLAPALDAVPFYIYKSAEAFREAMAATVREALVQGLYGWAVTDCHVTVTHSGYVSPVSSAADFRKLTPLVLLRALRDAGTVVCEPFHAFTLELPTSALGPVSSVLAKLGGVPRTTLPRGTGYVLTGNLPAAEVHALHQMIPSLTGGEGVLDATFKDCQALTEPFPSRPRAEPDPLNRKAYLTQLVGFWGAKGQHVR